jgi:phosphatidylglycerophosphatase A
MLLATGFGLGLSPVASGTTGSLPGVLLAVALCGLSWPAQAAAAVLLAAASIPVCDYAERRFKRKDDGRIVADEWMTFPLCLVGIPWALHPWFLGVAFVVARVFDILKPPPARGWQRVRGGLGIALDDIVAGLYALAVNHVLYACVTSWGINPFSWR